MDFDLKKLSNQPDMLYDFIYETHRRLKMGEEQVAASNAENLDDAGIETIETETKLNEQESDFIEDRPSKRPRIDGSSEEESEELLRSPQSENFENMVKSLHDNIIGSEALNLVNDDELVEVKVEQPTSSKLEDPPKPAKVKITDFFKPKT